MAHIIGAHLVGSAPVADATQWFDLAPDHVGSHLRRIGDGETGERDAWIRWQYSRLAQSPQLRPARPDAAYRSLEQFEVIEGSDQIDLVDLGYAEAAIESFAQFEAAKARGQIPDSVRFMVGLPTPLGVVTMYVAPGSRSRVLKAYGAAMADQLERILAAIDHGQLAIQWEMCIEFGVLEGLWSMLDSDDRGPEARPALAEHVTSLGELVPESVELGFHLCYGDSGHEHFTEPTDAGHLAWAIDAITTGIDRPVQWIHLPVPRDRDDAAYFEPLGEVDLPAETELYLGLVHTTGGIEGTRRRIAAAQTVVPRFGVATECGLGRRPLESIPALLDQHAQVAEPVPATRT